MLKVSQNENELSYEQAIKQLEEIVAKLDKGECSLDESMKLYEKGMFLSNHCDKLLKNFQQKVTVINDGKVE